MYRATAARLKLPMQGLALGGDRSWGRGLEVLKSLRRLAVDVSGDVVEDLRPLDAGGTASGTAAAPAGVPWLRLQRVIQVSIFSRRAKLVAPTLSSGDHMARHFVGAAP